ncbi:MAG: hypothetical protein ACYC9O_21615, partial [Candidatus Latescibacterota bacterium]
MNGTFFIRIKTGMFFVVIFCLGAFAALPGIGCDNNPVGPGDTSSQASQYQSEVPHAWFELQLKLVRETS